MRSSDTSCTECGLPPALDDQIQQQITTHGCAVLAVTRDVSTPYAYTVGLTERGKPELYLEDPEPTYAAPLLTHLAATFTTAHDLTPGQYVRTDHYEARLEALENTGALELAHQRYPDRVTALRVVLAA